MHDQIARGSRNFEQGELGSRAHYPQPITYMYVDVALHAPALSCMLRRRMRDDHCADRALDMALSGQ